MIFSKHILLALISTAFGGVRWRRWLAVCMLFVAAAAGLAELSLCRTQAQSQSQADTLHGAAAVERLKQDGQYDSLQAALEQARLTVSQTAQTPLGRAAWHAPNRAAGYDAYVTEAGVSIAINDKTYVSLHLQRLGYGQSLQAVGPGKVSGDERTINIERNAGLREWYVNSGEGLEHGFTLSEPFGGQQQDVPLRLAMQVSAGWQAIASEDGQRITLRNDGGQAVEYSQLVVRDARGLNIPAKLTVADEQVVIEVEDYDAQYPLMIDPIFTLQQRLTAADGSGGDFFGQAVALDGNTALVGAPYDNQSRGSAYVFVRNGAVWTQQARLFAQDGGAFDYFGGSVALKGDTALVGAVYGPGSASSDQGAAYVFFRVGTSWNLQQKLNANENTTTAQFGAAVALDGNTALVGAFSYALPATNNRAGAAFVFTRSNTLVWTQQARLTVDEGEYDDYFGIAVALEGDTALIGAPRHTVTTAAQGAAYVFTRNGTSWTPQQRILNTNPEANERFGNAVALSGENALIGAYLSGPDERGAAYSFRRGAPGWTQTGTLLAPNPKKDARLGTSVAFSGDTAVVSAARGLFDTGDDHRSAYVFVYSGEWLPVRQLGPELGTANDGFGYAVALQGETVLVGAYRTAVTTADQGAAYVLTLRDSRHAEQQKLIANDGKKNDYFGSDVALAGDTLAIAAVGTNAFSGAVYVFMRTGTPPVWRFQQKLTAPDGAIGDNFGQAVAISGNTLLVGAPFSDGRGLANQGAVYAFTRTGVLWQLAERPFTTAGADAAPNTYFGQSIALNGDTAVIGAPGLNNSRGAVFVFSRAGASWTQQTKFTAPDGTDKARLGESVAMAGNTVAAGAPYDTINGNKDQGSVSLFDLTPGARPVPKLLANEGAASERFGYAVALRGDTLAVGAPNQGFNGGVSAAYVFRLENSRWVQRQKLTTGNGATNNLFGQAVALGDGLLAVGTLGDRTGQRYNRGSVYVYGLAGQWQFQQKINPSDTVFDDLFGSALAISGDTLAVGAQADTIGTLADQGSVFVYTSPACPAITIAPDRLPNGAVGTNYNQSLTANGGSAGEYHFSVTSGALPPGLMLLGDQGLAGIPTTAGTYRFTIRATYYLSLCASSREYTLTITSQCPALTLNPPTLPDGLAGAVYNQTLRVTGGAGPYQFTLSSGALPSGLSLSAAGVLSGTPAKAGTYQFTIAAESNGCTGAQSYSLAIGSRPVSLVSAASYKPEVAPESIVAVFGVQMAEQTQVATGLPLPTELAGLSARIRDSQGVERLAPLFFVSPGQLNLQIPPGTATGLATINLSSGATGQFTITRTAASVFTANADGRGVPAAVYLIIRNGVTSYAPAARFDGNRYVPEPVRFDSNSDQVFLVLYGTGLRSGREVTARIGGLDANVVFAGAAPGFTGLDQVNIQIPFALRGRGELEVELYVENTPANTVLIHVR